MTPLPILGRVAKRVIRVLGALRITGDGQNPGNGDPTGFEKPQDYRP